MEAKDLLLGHGDDSLNHYQCYFDASHTPEISRCAYCVLVDGQVIHTHVQEEKIGTSQKAEKQAIYLLLQYIHQHIERGSKVEVYGDEKTVIERIARKGIRGRRNKEGKLYDRMEPHYELSIKSIPRKQNRIAHNLSRTGHIPQPQNPPKPKKNVSARLMLLDDIIIPNKMKYGSTPGQVKYQSRLLFFQKYGKMYKTIRVNADGMLLDGYISYLILKEHGIDEYSVDVEEGDDRND